MINLEQPTIISNHQDRSDSYWCYDGDYYDFSSYAKYHPGGIAIMMARGTDCTELVDQLHPFSRDKIQTILKKYKVKGLRATTANKSIVKGAYLDFLLRAENVLIEHGLSYSDVTKNSWGGWFYVAFWSVLFYGLLCLFLSGVNPWVVAPLLGIAMTFHTQYLVHEAGHLSLTKRTNLNYYLALYATGLIQYGEFTKDHWGHHLNTNDVDLDQDLFHLTDIFRLVPDQKLKAWHRVQHILFFFLGPIMGVFVAFNRFRQSAFRGLGLPWLPFKLTVWHKFVYVVFFILLNIWPFIIFGLTVEAVWAAIVPRAVQWYLYVNLFQWSHFHDRDGQSLTFYNNARESGFFEHVIATTQNVSEQNPIMKFMLVGNQVQHHLLPLVSTSWNHLFIDVTRQTCDKFGLNYFETPSVYKQIVSNYTYFRKMSKLSS